MSPACWIVLSVIGGVDASSPPLVDVPGLGSVQGVYVVGENVSEEPSNISVFMGLPFAKPPVGDLRWRSPAAQGPWTAKPLDGSKYSKCCMQTWPSYLPPNKTGFSEDCLYLNVFSPTAALNGKQKLPVMFWIHGGAYTTGCASTYPGMGMVNYADLKVVMVTTNYRLNVFGFLGSAELKPRTTDGSIGNYGIEDQRLAMGWVADHIDAFGGNPDDVTIFGESAGGSSVINHLTQRASFPLYKKAMIESGTYQGTVGLEDSELLFALFKKETQCANVTCLLNVPADRLNNLDELEQLWGPTVDGVALPDEPYHLIRKAQYNNKVPIMIGSNRDELALFVIIDGLQKVFPPTMGEAELDAILAGAIGLGNVQKVKELYDPSNYTYPASLGNYSQAWWTAVRVLTDSVPGLGACAARNFSQNFHKGGTPSVFTYLFAHPTQNAYYLPGSGPGSVLVPHGSEITYILAGLDNLAAGEESDLSIKMSRYWSTFAITGDPNADGLPKWAKYGDAGDVVQRLQAASEGGIIQQKELRKTACDFWDQHPTKLPVELMHRKLKTAFSRAIIV